LKPNGKIKRTPKKMTNKNLKKELSKLMNEVKSIAKKANNLNKSANQSKIANNQDSDGV